MSRVRYANDPEIERQIGAFGENMRAARRRAGMTQTDLAAVDGLDRAAISLTEKGKRSPDMRTLLRICQGLEVTPADLVRGIGPFAADGTSGEAKARSSQSHDSSAQTKPASGPATPFSENLHSARRKTGISQQTLGMRADVDAAAISLYERGQREPNLRTILKLARTLEMSPVELLQGMH
jgi:transcriptional regulator with XRE-family HTH domain